MWMRMRGLAGLIFVGLLAGCSSGSLAPDPADVRVSDAEQRLRQAGVQGSIFDMVGGMQAGNVRLGGGSEDALVGAVNRHLWRASLDTLAFMPIASTDPFTGVIATDWASTPDSPGERLKANVYITSTELTPQALRVAIFREALRNGQWVAVPVAEETPRRIEDAILTRARQLRIAEVEGNPQG
jgi:hypothetical protein